MHFYTSASFYENIPGFRQISSTCSGHLLVFIEKDTYFEFEIAFPVHQASDLYRITHCLIYHYGISLQILQWKKYSSGLMVMGYTSLTKNPIIQRDDLLRC